MLGHLHLVEDPLKERHNMLHLGGELSCQLTKLNSQWSVIEFTISPSEGGQRVAPELFHVPLHVATPGWVVFLLGQPFLLLLLASRADGGLVAMHPCQLSIASAKKRK